jgi:hypothetical protein
MNWNAIVEKVTPYIIKIETPRGHGTGFLCLYNLDRTFFGIATARHVVSYADEWQQPIRLQHYPSSTVAFLKEGERIIFPDTKTDSAVILVHSGQLQLPETPIPLLPNSISLAIGTEVGWLGFPTLADTTLCFFSGMVSARQEWRHGYLIDGVAIAGVSGGPVLYSTETEGVQIIGTISAYISRADTLPGLSIARDVSHFHDTISSIRSMDEAREQKQAQEQQTKEENPTDPQPPSSTSERCPPD